MANTGDEKDGNCTKIVRQANKHKIAHRSEKMFAHDSDFYIIRPRSGSQPSKIFIESSKPRPTSATPSSCRTASIKRRCAGETPAFVPRLIFNAKTLKLCSKIKFATQAQQTAPSRYAVECSQ